MSQDQLTVVAQIFAKRGYDSDIRKELLALVEPSRKESGCIGYVVHLSKEDPCRFMVYENWRSREDLDSHLEMPYLKEFLRKISDKLSKPVEITTWQIIG